MNANETMLIVLLALPFAGSLAAMLFQSNARNAEAWLAGGIALAVVLVTLQCYDVVGQGEVLRLAFPWLPNGQLDFALYTTVLIEIPEEPIFIVTHRGNK